MFENRFFSFSFKGMINRNRGQLACMPEYITGWPRSFTYAIQNDTGEPDDRTSVWYPKFYRIKSSLRAELLNLKSTILTLLAFKVSSTKIPLCERHRALKTVNGYYQLVNIVPSRFNIASSSPFDHLHWQRYTVVQLINQ